MCSPTGSIKLAQTDGQASSLNMTLLFCHLFLWSGQKAIPSVWVYSWKPPLQKGSPRVLLCVCGFLLHICSLFSFTALFQFSFCPFQYWYSLTKDRNVQYHFVISVLPCLICIISFPHSCNIHSCVLYELPTSTLFTEGYISIKKLYLVRIL